MITRERSADSPSRKLFGRALRFFVTAVAPLHSCVFLLAAEKPAGELLLSDGRLLVIEGVTWGKEHRIGPPTEMLDRLGTMLPNAASKAIQPDRREARIHLDENALVVWVNAIHPATGTNIDCQSIRMELVSEKGEVFKEETSHWFGGTTFWRVGHVFAVFPRTQENLTLRITPWRKGVPVTTTIRNPQPTQPAKWDYDSLPKRKVFGDFELTLQNLVLRTNGLPNQYWQSCVTYWEPVWLVRHNGADAAGWQPPAWVAEDATGNRGQFLGTNQPGLRFTATVFPQATNQQATTIIAALPQVNLSQLGTGMAWNARHRFGTLDIVALGILPPGTQVFSAGKLTTNSVGMGPVRGGGAPQSGWTGRSHWESPFKKIELNAHYTPVPTIYLRYVEKPGTGRIAVRLRDDQGRLWLTETEPQGAPQDVHSFLVKLPSAVTNVIPEIVVLKPHRAEFTVQTPGAIDR